MPVNSRYNRPFTTMPKIPSAIAAIIGVLEKVADILASREAKISGAPGTVRALTFHTQLNEELPSQAGLRFDRILGGAFLLLSCYLGWTGYQLTLGQSGPGWAHRLFGAALICEGVLLAIPDLAFPAPQERNRRQAAAFVRSGDRA
jgi:hypothetical protein